jgi:septum formation protein
MEQILESVTNHDDRSGTNSTTGPGRTTKTLIKLPILCADTTVALDDMVLGKPIDAHNATHILEQLSGKTHTVYTAIVLATESGFHTDLSTSLVTFKSLSQKEIEHYVSTRDCFGKAGAYGIQGYAARFISHLHGSYSGVMGLPLYETTELLRAYNVVT